MEEAAVLCSFAATQCALRLPNLGLRMQALGLGMQAQIYLRRRTGYMAKRCGAVGAEAECIISDSVIFRPVLCDEVWRGLHCQASAKAISQRYLINCIPYTHEKLSQRVGHERREAWKGIAARTGGAERAQGVSSLASFLPLVSQP